MRIGLDASFLHLPPSGTGTYLTELLIALQACDTSIELVPLVPPWSTTGEAPRRAARMRWDLNGVAWAARGAGLDLLHVPHFGAPLRPALPLVVTVHDVIPFVLPAYRATRAARWRLAVMRRTVMAARLILTPSHFSAGEIERVLGIGADRIRVTPEAASTEHRPAPDPAAGLPETIARRYGIRGRYLFNVGGLDARKNLPVLLEAFARSLPHLTAPVQLVIAGAAHTGNPHVFPPLAPVIDRLGLGEYVVMTGFVSATEKLALHQAASVYVTPSLYEGFGLTPLEAMACGIPVIAANRTSLPEVVGDAGLLIEPEPATFAAAMTGVLNDPGAAIELRRRGLARAATFSWDETARLTIDTYRDAMTGHPHELDAGER